MNVVATLAGGQMQGHSAMRLSEDDAVEIVDGYEDLGLVPINAVEGRLGCGSNRSTDSSIVGLIISSEMLAPWFQARPAHRVKP
jgi:hypothetical protein